MVMNKTVLSTVGVAALGVVLGACGANGIVSSFGGLAFSDARISLKDSSTPSKTSLTESDSDGAFALDVDGLTPPFLIRADSESDDGETMYSISADGEEVDVNELTTVVYAMATTSTDVNATYVNASASDTTKAAGRLGPTLDALKTVLAPLYSMYGVVNPLTDRAAVRAMLRDVRFQVSGNTVTVTNRATGGVIFTGSLDNLASGTFTAENLPGGTVVPPPPPADGAALYSANCASCHGTLATSSKLGTTAAAIQAAIDGNVGGMGSTSLMALTAAEVDAIAAALVVVTEPPPAVCTYGYGAWGACQSDGTQTRTVSSSTPAGCTGTPVLTQACTYVAPTCSYGYGAWGACQSDGTQTRAVSSSTPAGCTGTPVLTQSCTYVAPTCSYSYCAWGTCQSNNTQTRTVSSSTPAGCTGTPVLTQSCTYVAPTCSYSYSAWGTCQSNNTQTRTVSSSTPSGCTGTPVLSQSCTYVAPTCSYSYTAWGTCQSNNTQTRTVSSSTPSGCTGTPVLSQSCTYVAPTCTYTYCAWGTCQSNNTQTRTVSSSTPSGCTGTPVVSQSCTYTAPIDGKALYTQYCAGCHGTSKIGASASATQSAIDSNRGGMGSLKFLTPEQVAAIAAAR